MHSQWRALFPLGGLLALVSCTQDSPVAPSLGPSFDVIPASSVNGKIAFASDRDGNREIYVMEPDGSGQTGSPPMPLTISFRPGLRMGPGSPSLRRGTGTSRSM